MSLPIQPTLPIRQIVQGKNPREYFDLVEMSELEAGIRAVGVLEPIVVRPIAGTEQYEIIAGERRWRAARNVYGDDYAMPVMIKDVSDARAEAMAVIENHHRAAMSAAEEGCPRTVLSSISTPSAAAPSRSIRAPGRASGSATRTTRTRSQNWTPWPRSASHDHEAMECARDAQRAGCSCRAGGRVH